MQSRNTAISVWHGQPFEVPVLDAGMRWAIVRYRNPDEKPARFLILKHVFVVRSGQAFVAVGNEVCTSIRIWQFRSWLGWPKSKQLPLAVRKLSQRGMTDLTVQTNAPKVIPAVAVEIEQVMMGKEDTPRIAMQLQSNPTLFIPSTTLQLNPINDQPLLKTFQDAL
jgi:hypothetical protein